MARVLAITLPVKGSLMSFLNLELRSRLRTSPCWSSQLKTRWQEHKNDKQWCSWGTRGRCTCYFLMPAAVSPPNALVYGLLLGYFGVLWRGLHLPENYRHRSWVVIKWGQATDPVRRYNRLHQAREYREVLPGTRMSFVVGIGGLSADTRLLKRVEQLVRDELTQQDVRVIVPGVGFQRERVELICCDRVMLPRIYVAYD